MVRIIRWLFAAVLFVPLLAGAVSVREHGAAADNGADKSAYNTAETSNAADNIAADNIAAANNPAAKVADFVSAAAGQEKKSKAVRTKVKVLAEYPHDTRSYTQGLYIKDGVMYESSGGYGKSYFSIVDRESGKWLRKWKFMNRYFLEGACTFGDNIYILTWNEHTCFVYSLSNPENKFRKIGTATYQTEGWGLTASDTELIMSDGSSTLMFLDPSSFYCTRKVQVTLDGRAVSLLNELEYIEGKIWANVYYSDIILVIDPQSGTVERVIECDGLLPESLRTRETDVLNGIAYDSSDGSVYITGKCWPRLYKIARD